MIFTSDYGSFPHSLLSTSKFFSDLFFNLCVSRVREDSRTLLRISDGQQPKGDTTWVQLQMFGFPIGEAPKKIVFGEP